MTAPFPIPAAWGVGAYFDSGDAKEITFNCDCQENSADNWYFNDCTGHGIHASGVSVLPNFVQGSSPGHPNTTNPNYYSHVTINSSAAVLADIACGDVPDYTSTQYRLRIVNETAAPISNDIRMTGDAYATFLTPDSIALYGSGNSVSYNGTNYTTLNAAPALFAPSNPTGTTSSSLKMSGIGQTFTAVGSGQVLVICTGQCSMSGSGSNNEIIGRYGQYATTTVASGSNGGEISAVASWSHPSAGVLDVASTTGFASSGQILVAASGSTTAVVTYTGMTSTSFTGCAYVSGSATGTVSTGGAVTSLPANGNPVTGTSWGAAATPSIMSSSATTKTVPFSFVDGLNLTPGQAYWFDLANASSNNTLTSALSDIQIALTEMPAGA
jgi:hypothetical protein